MVDSASEEGRMRSLWNIAKKGVLGRDLRVTVL